MRGCVVRGRFFCVLSVVTAAVIGGGGSGAQQPAPDNTVARDFYTAKDRLQALRRASIYVPRSVSDADIITGPPQRADQFQLRLNDRVTCTFDKAGADKSGTTPKFDCRISEVIGADGAVQKLTDQMDEGAVKVKFRPDNREIYAEVVSTRLLWALGFYADSMFPVRLTCQNCPEDPNKGSGPVGTYQFNEGVIERKTPGREMTEAGKEDQGWSWKEFETVEAPNYQKDGLKMLAAFIIHSDNKPEQQRLVCDGVTVDQQTDPFTTTCEASRVYIQDVGATFGGGGAFTNGRTAKMNLEEWSGKKVWKKVGTEAEPEDCQAVLPKSWAATDGLGDPRISEEGRRFAAGLACQLSDQQIADLFTVARVSELTLYRNADGSFKNGLNEASVVRQWVDVFKRKREALAAGRCRWHVKPADLADIDNPMRLTTLPNSCAARPF